MVEYVVIGEDRDMINRCRNFKVISHRKGYIIGNKDENGDIVCQATRIYANKERAESELGEGRFRMRRYCSEGCSRCACGLKLGSWGVVDEDLPEGVRHYYFYIKAPNFTDLGKLLRDYDVVFDVYYNEKSDKFERVIVHDGLMNKFNYRLNKYEVDRVKGWVRSVELVEKELNKGEFTGTA